MRSTSQSFDDDAVLEEIESIAESLSISIQPTITVLDLVGTDPHHTEVVPLDNHSLVYLNSTNTLTRWINS
jgi:hypothetical protein